MAASSKVVSKVLKDIISADELKNFPKHFAELDINVRDPQTGETPFTWLMVVDPSMMSAYTFRKLLHAGADVHQLDKNGLPLHVKAPLRADILLDLLNKGNRLLLTRVINYKEMLKKANKYHHGEIEEATVLDYYVHKDLKNRNIDLKNYASSVVKSEKERLSATAMGIVALVIYQKESKNIDKKIKPLLMNILVLSSAKMPRSMVDIVSSYINPIDFMMQYSKISRPIEFWNDLINLAKPALEDYLKKQEEDKAFNQRMLYGSKGVKAIEERDSTILQLREKLKVVTDENAILKENLARLEKLMNNTQVAVVSRVADASSVTTSSPLPLMQFGKSESPNLPTSINTASLPNPLNRRINL